VNDCYEGDGYEFSIRLLDERRLFVHVTRAALEFLAGDEPAEQLTTLTACMGLLRERALLVHASTGAERVVLGPADVAGPSDAGAQRTPLLH
jgi:hypothetical protein